MYIHVYIYIYIHTLYIHIHICIYIYIYTHMLYTYIPAPRKRAGTLRLDRGIVVQVAQACTCLRARRSVARSAQPQSAVFVLSFTPSAMCGGRFRVAFKAEYSLQGHVIKHNCCATAGANNTIQDYPSRSDICDMPMRSATSVIAVCHCHGLFYVSGV